MKKQKLELTWIGKENRPKLEPRILLEDPAKSYHSKHRVTDKDIFDNRLIFGDNLLALKALEQEFTGKVKCVFIDPPYNTGSAFTHYDDGLEHSIWLSLMRDRLEIIRRLLTEDGSLWITIDDNEAHYLKVMCDEVFGRKNFAANCLWQKVYSERMDARGFSVSHDHVLVYRKSERFEPIQLFKDQNSAQFGFLDENTRKHYRRRSLRKEGSESRREDRPSMWYSIKAPDGTDVWPVSYAPFTLDLSGIRYQPVDRDLLIQHLRTHEQETLSFSSAGLHELRLEDYVVRGLSDRDDVDYDSHADFLYGLAGQVVAHLTSYLSEDDTRNVLIYHQKQIAAFVYVQMQAHQQEPRVDFDVVVKKGFTRLKGSAYTAKAGEPVHDFRQTIEDKSGISKMVFGGFQHCLFEPVKFQSDTERRLSIIIEREAEKWLRPAKGQFQIFYKLGVETAEYVPDFVAETHACIYMLESKARNEIGNAEVTAKKEAAEKWCGLASAHTAVNGGKPWRYMLIPHDTVSENATLEGLESEFRG